MFKSILPFLLACTLFATSTSLLLACSAAGPNTHVGSVTSIDNAKNTFTIHDVETNQPITFSAPEKLLLKLASAAGHVVVRYSGKEAGNLIATNIE